MTVYDVTKDGTHYTLDAALEDGCLEFSGVDTGKAVLEFFGESQYEYWMELDEVGTDKLLNILKAARKEELPPEELLKGVFHDMNATAILREICEKNDIKIQFHCWP